MTPLFFQNRPPKGGEAGKGGVSPRADPGPPPSPPLPPLLCPTRKNVAPPSQLADTALPLFTAFFPAPEENGNLKNSTILDAPSREFLVALLFITLPSKNLFLINDMAILENKIASLRKSFTTEEIVAKMLGWLRGPNFPANIKITGTHFSEDQLIRLSTLEFSLEMHLTQLLNAAIDDYSVCGDDVPYEIAIVKEEAIERIEALSQRALRYESDIKHEIMKGRGSMLDEDSNVRGANGEACYTFTSADNWSKAHHGISIINYVEPVAELIEDTLVVERDGEGSEKGLNKTVVNNFYITFALLIEAFIEAKPDYALDLEKMMAPGYQGRSIPNEDELEKTKLVVSKLGKYLERRSVTPGKLKFARGQGDEAIMTHIGNAMRYKAKVWEARKVPNPLMKK